jgi:hypothetical protein
MNENQIVEAVCEFIEQQGGVIRQRLTTDEQGVDIIAEFLGEDCYIEAKGATSADPNSARFGMPFTRSQIFDRVSKGFYTAACLRQQHPGNSIVGLALPDTPVFREFALAVEEPANHLRIRFFWVCPEEVILQ